MIPAAITLSIYISRQFAASVLAMLMALSGLVSMFDFIELHFLKRLRKIMFVRQEPRG